MKVIGITGGIGSGKSSVCSLLEERGARVFYADRVARDLQVSDAGVQREILNAFGSEAYLEDGSLNRAYIASRVFSSDEDRMRINAIVHPAVADAFTRYLADAAESGDKLVVKEAALLLQTDTSALDEIWVVDAPRELRVQRVMERDSLSRDEVEARMGSQLSAREMRRRADRVVVNNGSRSRLEEEVRRCYDAMMNKADKT
jgi:dephospho-CoA kinase